MALAKKCDRCGNLYEHYPIGNMPGVCNAICKMRQGYSGSTECTGAIMDLCPDCMESFMKFMKGYEVVNVEETERINGH